MLKTPLEAQAHRWYMLHGFTRWYLLAKDKKQQAFASRRFVMNLINALKT